ncbi:Ribosomal-protein-S18p-alanine acetyltransferase [Salipiger mucosus DSM 16094]|uniref:[Ribosomal protein bS18]-alanine N-acetyltransferase n=2 Tax=Salipiger mucosus TaxID=263378 RepID=S9SI05_9RHOB|nr:ribosomal protein S18-alanine N-acetyltransferase [Salipiger mucosus]EPX85969.1 Ribosomal-protein-S18p-alanine acetyltransferase [Salipiger mucosus DSM 16094]
MTPDRLAEIAARAYRHMTPWTAADIRDTLKQPSALLVTRMQAFVLGRVVADEAEIFALATDPEHQRRGAARAALAAFEQAAAERGAATVLLEVAEENEPARAFYAACGYEDCGRRRGYYHRPDGSRDDALLMRRSLTGRHPADTVNPAATRPKSG